MYLFVIEADYKHQAFDANANRHLVSLILSPKVDSDKR